MEGIIIGLVLLWSKDAALDISLSWFGLLHIDQPENTNSVGCWVGLNPDLRLVLQNSGVAWLL